VTVTWYRDSSAHGGQNEERHEEIEWLLTIGVGSELGDDVRRQRG
jgi:hypothetical protein